MNRVIKKVRRAEQNRLSGQDLKVLNGSRFLLLYGIEKSRAQILAFYDEPITTGPLEGLNNKIKVLKRVAYGYRDIDFFQLRVWFIHEIGAKLTGV